MQELAFTVFTGCGGPVSSHELLNTMRLQLEVIVMIDSKPAA